MRTATRTPEVVRVYPHDRNAFTQGLTYVDGFLYESMGVNGRSTLRKVELETGRVLQQTALSREYFGEGLTSWGPDLVQLTWTSNLAFLYDRMNFQVKRTFNYSGQGWGITHHYDHHLDQRKARNCANAIQTCAHG